MKKQSKLEHFTLSSLSSAHLMMKQSKLKHFILAILLSQEEHLSYTHLLVGSLLHSHITGLLEKLVSDKRSSLFALQH
jgi:hypothetical protein